MKNIYFENGKNCNIKETSNVKVVSYKNNDEEVKIKNSVSISGTYYLGRYARINSTQYVDKQTGEIKDYNISDKRAKCSIRKSMKKLDDLIKNNFNGNRNEIFLTLTYERAEVVFDNAVKDLENFVKKLKKEFQDLEYIAVIENQRVRKSWHIHLLIKDIKHKILYIHQDELARIWNKGHVSVSRITDRDIKKNINNALDNKMSPINKISSYMSKCESKEDIPKGKKMYYKSRGIVAPEIREMTYKEAVDLMAGDYYLISEKTILVKSCKTDNILKRIKEEKYIKK